MKYKKVPSIKQIEKLLERKRIKEVNERHHENFFNSLSPEGRKQFDKAIEDLIKKGRKL